MNADNLDLRPGGWFLDYQVEECLGEGGMGEVYAAVEKNSGIEVAIKSLRGCYLGREDFVLRLQQECKLYSKLRHPNIVRMYRSVFTPDGRVFIVMERIRGKTIRKLLQSARRLDFLNAIHVMLQVAEAIGASHEAGIWHRDLKPENVMIGTAGGIRGHVWVLDFGIATDQSFNTDELPRIGTGRYMAPEQVRNQKADGRGDIYAFGVMFYELITGKHIFLVEGENVPMEQIMIGHLHADPPRPVHEIVPDCPETLWPILEHCLEKDPGQRYATMDEVADDLRAILRASLPPEHPLARRILQEKLRVERRAAFDTLAPEAPEDVAPAPAEAGTTTAGHRVTEPLIGFVPSASVLPFSSPRGPLPPPRPPPRGKGFTEEMPRLAPSAVHAARAVRPLAATPPVQTTPLVHIKTAAPARSSSPARSSTPSQPTGAGRSRSTLPLSYFLAPLAGLLLTLSGTIVVATIRSDRSAISPAQPGALPPSGAGTTGDPSPSATVTSPPIASVSAPVPDPISVVPTSIPAPPGATVVPAPPTASAAPKPPKPTSKPVAPAPKPTAPVPLFEFGGDTGSKTTPGKRK